jgi:hypothetical protein
MDRWRDVGAVTASLRSWGQTWSIKSRPSIFSAGFSAKAATTHQAVEIDPFTSRRGLYTPERVRIESADGTILQDRRRPREAFDGHELETPWDQLHYLYFAGYALWTYFNLPFVATRLDVDVQEIEPWPEGSGQQWRRLRLTLPPQIATHSSVQDLYIDENGLIARHDYTTDVIASLPFAHYLYDYADHDGIMFPSLRKVVSRNADNRPGPLDDPERLLVGIEFDSYRLT